MLQSASLLLEVRDVDGRTRRLPVDADGFLIGRGDFCDLQLDEAALPLVHSEIHLQDGVAWIEVVDAAAIEINGRAVPRLTLRSGDVLQFGSLTGTVRMGADVAAGQRTPVEAWEDLAALSAFELCERIESEQSAILEDERRRFQGIESLLVALETVLRTDQSLVEQDPRTENVVTQLHDLSEALAARTRQLQEQEQQFLVSASEIKQSQDEMARRLEDLIQHLDTGNLRASA